MALIGRDVRAQRKRVAAAVLTESDVIRDRLREAATEGRPWFSALVAEDRDLLIRGAAVLAAFGAFDDDVDMARQLKAASALCMACAACFDDPSNEAA